MNYAELSGEPQPQVEYNAKTGVAEYYEEELVYSEDEDFQPTGIMEHEHKETLQAWLADKNNWAKMKGLGKGFEGGAKLVPIEGDGNCFFSSVSTALTFNRENPYGTPDQHNDIRKKCCDWIEKEKNSEVLQNIFSKRKNPFETDADFKKYVWKKRQTTGEMFTWSDGATANAAAAVCGKGPIMQVIYPVHKDGVPQPQIPPKIFLLSKTGDRTKLPIYIHWNGINHYNAIVPASYQVKTKSVSPKNAAPRATGFKAPPGRPMPFAHHFGGLAALQGGAPTQQKAKSPARQQAKSPARRGPVQAKAPARPT